MYNQKAKHSCSVVGCTDPHASLHRLPKKEDIRGKWLNFIYQGNVPASVGKSLVVCAKHFRRDCFSNQGQFNAGLAMRLFLNDGSVPTVRDNATDEGTSTAASTCQISPTVRDVACQTDPPKRISVGTQLSMKTLQSHFRSRGIQAKVTSRDFGMCTLTFPLDSPLLFLQPTIVKRPSERPQLSLTDEGEGPCLSMVVNESDD